MSSTSDDVGAVPETAETDESDVVRAKGRGFTGPDAGVVTAERSPDGRRRKRWADVAGGGR
jgi:hypothetical protein